MFDGTQSIALPTEMHSTDRQVEVWRISAFQVLPDLNRGRLLPQAFGSAYATGLMVVKAASAAPGRTQIEPGSTG